MTIAPFAPGRTGHAQHDASGKPQQASPDGALGFLAELVAAVGAVSPLVPLVTG